MKKLLLLLFVVSWQALGADSLPLGSLEPGASGNVSDADTMSKGGYSSEIGLDASGSQLPENEISEDETDKSLAVSRVNRLNAGFSMGLSKSVQLSLGLHGTYEAVGPERRDAILAKSSSSSVQWRNQFKETAFSSVSIMSKINLAETDGLRFSVAPFIESGAGPGAQYAVSRSESAKAGWLAMMTYGSPNLAEISFNAGMRYRDPEALGSKTLRNEIIYRMKVMGKIAPSSGLFAAVHGTSQKIGTRDDTGTLAYSPKESGALLGGWEFSQGRFGMNAYVGTKISGYGGVGYGNTMFGAALSYTIGDKGRDYEESPIIFTEEGKRRSEQIQGSYPEMQGDVDPYTELNSALQNTKSAMEKDDFDRVQAEKEKNPTGPDMKALEEEIKEINVAEERAQALRKKRRANMEAQVRAEERARAQDEAARQQRVRAAAEREAEQLYKTTFDDIDWSDF